MTDTEQFQAEHPFLYMLVSLVVDLGMAFVAGYAPFLGTFSLLQRFAAIIVIRYVLRGSHG